ncbi:MAG: hypothetical protein J6P05_05705, partial [Lachnospiraceae bacterium]|nr:hypothetical protein [Lachnospiraceae bacterium]
TSNATNMDHNLEHFSSKKKHCPYCGADATDEMFRFGEGVVHNGQRCTRDSSHMWIYGDRVH